MTFSSAPPPQWIRKQVSCYSSQPHHPPTHVFPPSNTDIFLVALPRFQDSVLIQISTPTQHCIFHHYAICPSQVKKNTSDILQNAFFAVTSNSSKYICLAHLTHSTGEYVPLVCQVRIFGGILCCLSVSIVVNKATGMWERELVREWEITLKSPWPDSHPHSATWTCNDPSERQLPGHDLRT